MKRSIDHLSDRNISINGNVTGKKSRKEKQLERIQSNKEWKLRTRMLWSNEDPNPRHTAYYNLQLPDLIGEWESFQETITRPLPVTFRLGHRCVNGFNHKSLVGLSVKKMLKSKLVDSKGRFFEHNGNVLNHTNLLQSVSWMMDEAWSLAVDSTALSKNESLRYIHDLITHQVNLGNIVRQEIVSMIPAKVLDVKEFHTVVDLCSAPGSKTEQILSIMQSQCTIGMDPVGVVIANDADPKRISRLQERYRRCGSKNLMLSLGPAEILVKKLGEGTVDRVICDVPCTGDGTFRKSPHLWRLFRPRMAVEIHPLQLQIALAGVKLLKPGGRMIYSTCSINPIEDEAVVAALINAYGGSLKLVDLRNSGQDILGNFITRPGLHHWHSDVDSFLVGESNEKDKKDTLSKISCMLDSIHPPTKAVACDMHLEYCMRVLPHDQDTGGFFIAVLQLVEEQSAMNDVKAVHSPFIITNKEAREAQAQLGYNPKTKKSLDSSKKDTLKLEVLSNNVESYMNNLFDSSGIDSQHVISHLWMNQSNVDAKSNYETPIYFLSEGLLKVFENFMDKDAIIQCGSEIGIFHHQHNKFYPHPDNFLHSLRYHISSKRVIEVNHTAFQSLTTLGVPSLESSNQHHHDTSTKVPITLQDVENIDKITTLRRNNNNNNTSSGNISANNRDDYDSDGLEILFDINSNVCTYKLNGSEEIECNSTMNELLIQTAHSIVNKWTVLHSQDTNKVNNTLIVLVPQESESITSQIPSLNDSQSMGSIKRRLSKAEKKRLKNMDPIQNELPDDDRINNLSEEKHSLSFKYDRRAAGLLYFASIDMDTNNNKILKLERITRSDTCRTLAHIDYEC